MNRKLAEKVAAEHGVTADEVIRDVEHAINHALAQPNSYAQGIQSQGEKPTADEVIAHLVNAVRANLNCKTA